MEVAQMILLQPMERLRYPHVTMKILELACPTFADLTRLRRVSKDWMSYIDWQFLEKPENQEAIQKEKLNFPWINGKMTKIELPWPIFSNRKLRIREYRDVYPIDDDSFYCLNVSVYNRTVPDRQRRLAIFFKEKCMGTLRFRHNPYVQCIVQLDQAQRLMIITNRQLSEWKLNSNTDHYYKSRIVRTFSTDLTLRLSLMFGRPFVFWIDQAQLNIFSAENSVSSSIQLPSSRFDILDVHSRGQDRAFVNLKSTSFSAVNCVVVVDSQEKPIKYMPGTQSLSGSSDYLVSMTKDEVKVIDKATLTPVATSTKLEVPDLFNYCWPNFLTVSGNKVVYEVCKDCKIIKSYNFKNGEITSLTMQGNYFDVVINDSLLTVLGKDTYYNDYVCQCADLDDLEKPVFSYDIPDSRFCKRWIKGAGQNKLIGLYRPADIKSVHVWKFGKEH